MSALLLALVVQTIVWFVPAQERQTWPVLVEVETLGMVGDGWVCGRYVTDDVLTLSVAWPCLAHITHTVLHEWGHRVCWQTWADISEACAEAYARRVEWR
jgi:hypothetical protein